MSHKLLSGLNAWLVQRLSALFMLFFTLAVWMALVSGPPLEYVQWRALFAHPLLAITITLFFIALLLHAWVGIRDVILDYAGGEPMLRLLLLALLGGWLIAMGIWALRILMMAIVL